MAESDGQERTEDPTTRRLQQAREKGQVARSKELATVALLVAGAAIMMLMGDTLGMALMEFMGRMFTLTREEIFDFSVLMTVLTQSVWHIVWPLMIILCALFVAAVIGAAGIGGINWSLEAAMPKWSKMNPLSGLKRMVGMQSLMELVKSILKVILVAGVAVWLMRASMQDLFEINRELFPNNLFHALSVLLRFVLLISCSLLVVAAIDIPYQIWQHTEQLKMTKQEVKDEYKDTEGKPEVKGRIRMLQREAAQRRMMSEVPQADVIITNPEHFSVALRYDPDLDSAPIVVAKGIDHIALKIREIANENEIDIVPAPPLARALYHTTELEQQIPDGLFTAVAQVLAYVFQLKEFRKGRGKRPNVKERNFEPPTDMRYDN
ncbi:flagellar biosynthesis protein FlhB [Thaumasiovibrio subtropicus]|uniref:flagellar biosynthesis protein FlhB n=1 Tax=Thaumasiovibrio subtropicus TaxID=1891207 RepID=UPI000B357B1E|nr:flagellar biosynthesis protein FlhB [Thaumasiovibrio subtropicus]